MIETNTNKSQLIDRFGREVTYVRLSVTDRCDLRCVYCMSEDMKFVPREQLLTLEEMNRIGKAFIDLGVNKIRLTGGEPLTRRNILSVFEALGAEDNLKDLTVTTNGTLLEKYAQPLKDAGVTRINISLDTLRTDRFKKITRIGKLENTLAGIEAALKVDFQKIKLNTVIMHGYNDDEIIDFISPHSHNFCEDCNRVRVTAEGMLLLCLGQEHSLDLRKVVRANPDASIDDDKALKEAIIGAMQLKPKGHDFNLNEQPIIMRHMSATGG